MDLSLKLSFPECDNDPSANNERAADEDRCVGDGSEGNEIDNLPNDEQRRDIEADNAPKFDGARGLQRGRIRKAGWCRP
jgi:hypothetical protein